MACLEIRLLGEIEVRRDGQLLVFPTQKVKELFAYLVIYRDHAHPRVTLATLLWPESDEEHGRANLRKNLSLLRKMLNSEASGTRWLVSSGGAVRFNTAAGDLWLDLEEFERLVALAPSPSPVAHLRERGGEAGVRALEQAIALYRGPPLPGVYENWALAESERLQALYLDALEQLAEMYQTQRRFEQAITMWTKVLHVIPWHERAHRELITLYALIGDRAAALQQYSEYCSVLQKELHAPPLPETQTLYERILRGAPPEPIHIFELPVETPFVGRERECQVLSKLWQKACDGAGQALLIGGEVGVGKTSFVEHFIEHIQQLHPGLRPPLSASREGAEERSYSLQGAAYAGELPYEPLLQAVREGLKSTSVATLSRLPALWQNELAQFVPELQERFPDLKPNPPSPQGKARWFAALTAFFEIIADERPLILFLDDVHWADEATLEYLSYLIAHLKNHRILLIGTYRTEEALEESSLRTWLDKLEPGHLYQALTLPRLSQEETCWLVERLLVGAVRELLLRLYAETEGNPLFLVKLVRSLVASGALQRDPEGQWKLTTPEIGAAQVPESLRELIKTSLRRVPRRAYCVLHVAAVAGRTFEFPILKEILRQSEETLLDRLDELRRVGLIVEQEGRYQFYHELVRQVVYEELSADRKKLWHRRIGETLERLYPDRLDEFSGELARHFERAQRWDKAIPYALRAGQRAQRAYAYGEALKLLERAFQLFENLGARQTARLRTMKLDLLSCYTDLFPSIYDIKPALQELEPTIREMIALAQEVGATDRLCQAYQKKAWIELAAGRREAAQQALRQALEVSQKPSHAATAQALYCSGDVYGQMGEYSQSLEYFQRAGELWASLGDLQHYATALKSSAVIQLFLGEYEQARHDLEGALSGFQATADLWGQAAVFNNLGIVLYELGRWADAQGHYERAYQLMNEVKDRRGLGVILLNLGTLHIEQGRYDAALSCFEQVLGMLKEVGLKGLEVGTLSEKGRAHLRRGELGLALDCSTRAMQALEAQHGMISQAHRFYFIHYQILQANGRTDEAKVYLQKAHDEVCRVAGQIREESLRASFLQNVPINQKILQAFGHRPL
jgi:DNA-binding SARP family transcriptional activator